jgi:programmed cell death protein 4
MDQDANKHALGNAQKQGNETKQLAESPTNGSKADQKGKTDSPHTSRSASDPQKQAVLEIISEFIESADLNDAVADVERRVDIEGIEFVKRALIFGIERKAYERELISQLLSAVYNIFRANEMCDGFQTVLDRLPDLVLDVPDATEVLGKFLARAEFDEITPPIFLEEAKINNPLAKRAVSLARETTNSEDKKRLDRIWGPGDLSSVRRLRKEVDAMLKEYLENSNANDAIVAVRDLNAPSFNSQVVRQALTLALERNNEESRKAILSLLSAFKETAVMSSWDILHGYTLIWRRIQDVKLDVPNAEEMLSSMTNQAKKTKILADSFDAQAAAAAQAIKSPPMQIKRIIH